jgi:hypothetical protein
VRLSLRRSGPIAGRKTALVNPALRTEPLDAIKSITVMPGDPKTYLVRPPILTGLSLVVRVAESRQR